MNDVEAHTVELLLQYVYGFLKPDLTLAETMALFEASDKYAMTILNQQCTRLLKSLISFDNVFELADVAQLHQSASLLQVNSTHCIDCLSAPIHSVITRVCFP